MKQLKHFVKAQKPDWLTRRNVLKTFAVLALAGGVLCLGYAVEWTGFSKDVSDTKVDRKVKTKDEKGNEIEIVTTTTIQDPKKIWDWLSLLGVPLALAMFGYWLQVLQQRRANAQEALDAAEADRKTQTEKAIAEARIQEETFQNYIDRMSALLVDKNLISVAKIWKGLIFHGLI